MGSCSETLLIRELKKQRRRLKSEVALFQTLPRLFHLLQFVKCWQSFLELNSKDCIEVHENKNKVLDKTWNLAFSRRSRVVFCLSQSIAFLPFSLTSPSSLLKFPIASMSAQLMQPNHDASTSSPGLLPQKKGTPWGQDYGGPIHKTLRESQLLKVNLCAI